MLPRGSGAGVVGGQEDEEESDQGDLDEDEDDDEDVPSISPARDFSILDEKIRQVIQRYDGEVFPKLDWSAPRDAAWILPGQTLKCSTPADVYLLLKSSDFVGKDLTQLDELKQQQQQYQNQHQQSDSSINGTQQPQANDDPSSVQDLDSMASLTLSTQSDSLASTSTSGSGPGGTPSLSSCPPRHLNLILKRHFNLNPSHEFRCFVRANQFVAITQRDAATYYPFLQDSSTRRDIRKKLLDFWSEHLRNRHVIQDYIFDVYFTRNRSRVFLIDLNPYLPRTDAILWDWDELEKRAKRRWRCVQSKELPQEEQEQEEEGDLSSEDDDDDEDDDEDDTGSSASSSSSSSSRSSSPDPRGEPFIRIYTDGRPPTTHYQPHPPRRTHRILPSLRLIRSERESSAAGSGSVPMYATNMVPKDIIDVSNGNGVEEFARVWREQQQEEQGGSS